jgi:hypothetical protein
VKFNGKSRPGYGLGSSHGTGAKDADPELRPIGTGNGVSTGSITLDGDVEGASDQAVVVGIWDSPINEPTATEDDFDLAWDEVNSAWAYRQRVSLAPTSDTRNRIESSGNFVPLSLRQDAGQTADLFQWYESGGTKRGNIDNDGANLRISYPNGPSSNSGGSSLVRSTWLRLGKWGSRPLTPVCISLWTLAGR